jgi:MYXO-CTERM domain-containing protein
VRPGSLDDFVVTRLHARYSKDALGDDLFFRAAPPIVGGREFVQTAGKLEQGARPDSANNFQARYVIRHPWTGPMACRHPRRGVWGGPPSGGGPAVKPAAKIGFLRQGGAATLATCVGASMPSETFLSGGGATPMLSFPASGSALVDAGTEGPTELDAAGVPEADAGPTPPLPPTAPAQGGCAGCAVGTADAGSAGAVVALMALAFARLRRRGG